jgi:hypothetical protein
VTVASDEASVVAAVDVACVAWVVVSPVCPEPQETMPQQNSTVSARIMDNVFFMAISP